MNVSTPLRLILRRCKGVQKITESSQIAARNLIQRRYLSIHEYQAQGLLRDAGILVPNGELARTPKEVADIASRIGTPCVVKSQVHAGGRGKGRFDNGLQGGIHVVKSPEEAEKISSQMLGHRLITKQTSEKGLLLEKVYVVEKVKYNKEFYLSLAIDRENYCPAIIVSREGGMNIEDAAKKDPTSVARIRFDYIAGIADQVVDQVAQTLQITESDARGDLQDMLKRMFDLFKSKDATLLEINPLVQTDAGRLLCLDAKFNFDNAAQPRQPDLFEMEEKETRDGAELEAEKSGLVYIRLDGNIGNLVNGAGLAMATNDAISFFGGKSANFLDAGGQATKDTIVNAFKIILSDERVKVMLVNIYGGIIRCDMIAESIIAAAKELHPLPVPLVVRLQGTNSEQGQKMIADSGLELHAVDGFGDAAKLATELASK